MTMDLLDRRPRAQTRWTWSWVNALDAALGRKTPTALSQGSLLVVIDGGGDEEGNGGGGRWSLAID